MTDNWLETISGVLCRDRVRVGCRNPSRDAQHDVSEDTRESRSGKHPEPDRLSMLRIGERQCPDKQAHGEANSGEQGDTVRLRPGHTIGQTAEPERRAEPCEPENANLFSNE